MSELAPDHDPAADDPLDRPEAGGRAIRGVAIRTITFGGGLVLNLLAVPFMIRHLGPVDYGYYITVASIVFLVGAVTEAGLTNLGVRHWAAGDVADRRDMVRNLIGLRLALTLAGLLLATGIAALAGAPRVVVLGTFVYGMGLLVSMIAYTYAVPLSASLRLGTTSALDFLRQALLAVGTIVLVILGASLLPFFALWVVVSAVAVVATAAFVRGEISIRPAFDAAKWLEFLKASIAYSIAAAVGLIYFRVAVVSISALSTDLEAGYYAAPFRIIETAANLPWMFVTSVFPILARAATRDLDRLRYAVQRVTEVGLIFGIWMTLVLILAAEPAMAVIGGLPEFEPSIPVLRLQALTLVSTFLVATWSLLLLSLHEHRTLLICNGLAVVVAIVAAVILIPPMGAEGGALTTIAAETFLAGAYIVAQQRKHPEVRFGLGVLPKLALATALGAALLLTPLPPVAQAAVASLVYFAALLATRGIPLELWSALRPRL
jgi:O-antigen/teichoic acid export membrane protein